METVTLNDGTMLVGHCIEDDRNLFVYIDRMTIPEGVALFSDPEKTSHIVEMNHGNEHVYDGFTMLVAVNSEFGNCNLTMRKGV